MIYMQNFKNSEKAEDLLSAFSLSIDSFTQSNEKDLLDKVQKKLKAILLKEHSGNPEKQKVDFRERNDGTTRLNFACPYCGDSTKDDRKKRGNLYIPGFNFHCFNCRTHTTLEIFLTYFNNELDPADKVYVHNENERIKQEIRANTQYLDFSYVTDFEMLEKYAIPRDVVMKHWNLTEIEQRDNWWIKKYLKGRGQEKFQFFANDKKMNRFFIFNLTPRGNVLGIQVRNFKREPKYVTHTLEMMYGEMGKEIDKNDKSFKEANRLSFLFGISTVNFNKPITVFEGPLDSFLFENGMSVCGIDNDFPLDIPVRWMYDFDKAGLIKAIEKINNAEEVFLWKKYIKDIKLRGSFYKLDFTDLKKYINQQGLKELPFDEYFSNEKYDAYLL